MWIQTLSGKRVNLGSPNPSQIIIGDIAHGLSNVCRFSGQIQRFYSVAQHSVHVADLARGAGLSPAGQLYALLHDASEAYLGDVPSPVKALCDSYMDIERRVMLAVEHKFGIANLDVSAVKMVHHFDKVALATEFRDLISGGGEKHHTTWDSLKDVETDPKAIRADFPAAAQFGFMEKYHSIMGMLDAGVHGSWATKSEERPAL